MPSALHVSVKAWDKPSATFRQAQKLPLSLGVFTDGNLASAACIIDPANPKFTRSIP
jgi:hypothetical protein